MNDRKYHFLLVMISVVIAATLAIQVYWNYNNFQESKRELVADLQIGLDESVEVYYQQLVKNNNVGIIVQETTNRSEILKRFFKDRGEQGFNFENINVSDISELRIYQGVDLEDLNEVEPIEGLWSFPTYDIEQPNGNYTDLEAETFFADQANINKAVASLTSKLVVSLREDEMDLERLDSLVGVNIKMQGLNIDYKLKIESTDREDFLLTTLGKNALRANSELLKPGDALLMTFSSLSPNVYRLNLTGIILSTILIASIVFCLFYLLKIIKNQKALGEMKNDLISNITHEFKTPIATASLALEGVQSFTKNGDLDKTDRYLSMGRDQLTKLNGMVERILETATLDSQELMLQKSKVETVELIETVINKHQTQTSKKITFSSDKPSLSIMADAFHLENAINNLIDNAVKYGGDSIKVNVLTHKSEIIITVMDSGKDISSKDVKLIFDKFYRVGKGNRHDVKGFGIGLFYTKSIIEKHNGTITATAQPQTTFKITLPHE